MIDSNDTLDIISLIIRVVGIVIFLQYIIPLQIKESRVKNGLKKLRQQLLLATSILIFINVVSIVFLVVRISDLAPIRSATNILSILNGLSSIFIAIIFYQIYHQQYSPEQKKRHAQIEKLEAKDEKLDNKSKKE